MLTDTDKDRLDFEQQWWRYPGAKDAAIREKFNESSTRYYQVLDALADPRPPSHTTRSVCADFEGYERNELNSANHRGGTTTMARSRNPNVVLLPEPAPRVLGLVRVSKERDGMVAPEIQVHAIETYANARGYQITCWLEGLDESGVPSPLGMVATPRPSREARRRRRRRHHRRMGVLQNSPQPTQVGRRTSTTSASPASCSAPVPPERCRPPLSNLS